MAKTLYLSVSVALLLVTSAAGYRRHTPCGGTCGGYRPPCEPGTRCTYGKCKGSNLDVGAACSSCKTCKSSLECKNGKCAEKMNPPSSCGGTCGKGLFPSNCADGSSCVGNVCTKNKQQVGDSCAKSCESCDSGLECKSGKCAQKMNPPSACGGKCGTGLFPNACSDGSSCVGNVCKKNKQKVGASCAKSCESCNSGLECKEGKCAKKMNPPSACGGKCGTGLFPSTCSDGSTCVGGRCKKMSQGEGKSCAKGCEKCASTLRCQQGICKPKITRVGCGATCGGSVLCARGFKCLAGTCKKMSVREGQKCSSCETCRPGLLCKDGKCAKAISACGGKCGKGSKTICEPGTICKKGTCIKMVGPGQSCGGCQLCARGSSCNSHTKKCAKRGYGGY